jgi:hypothetical protein
MNDNYGLLIRNPRWEAALILNRLRNARQLNEHERNAEDSTKGSNERGYQQKPRYDRQNIDCGLSKKTGAGAPIRI